MPGFWLSPHRCQGQHNLNGFHNRRSASQKVGKSAHLSCQYLWDGTWCESFLQSFHTLALDGQPSLTIPPGCVLLKAFGQSKHHGISSRFRLAQDRHLPALQRLALGLLASLENNTPTTYLQVAPPCESASKSLVWGVFILTSSDVRTSCVVVHVLLVRFWDHRLLDVPYHPVSSKTKTVCA